MPWCRPATCLRPGSCMTSSPRSAPSCSPSPPPCPATAATSWTPTAGAVGDCDNKCILHDLKIILTMQLIHYYKVGHHLRVCGRQDVGRARPGAVGCSASTRGGRARSSPAPASSATASSTWSRALGTTAPDLFSLAEDIKVSMKDLTTTSWGSIFLQAEGRGIERLHNEGFDSLLCYLKFNSNYS